MVYFCLTITCPISALCFLDSWTPTPQLLPLATMERQIVTAPHATQCKYCKRKDAIPPGDTRASCERCREQRKKYYQRKRLRDLEEKASLLHSSNKAEKDAVNEPGEANLETKKKKRKHTQAGSVDLPGLPLVKKVMIIDICTHRSDRNLMFSQKKKLSGKTRWTEYQTADGMYETLRDLMASTLLPEFRGRFSIVMDLKIDHLKRASAVAHNLRTIARCSIA